MGDPDGLERERGEEAQAHRLPLAVDGLAVGGREPPERPRLVHRREHLALGRNGLHLLREHAVDVEQVGHEAVDLDRPRLLVDLGQRGEDDRGRQERAGVERAAGLLEEDRLVEEREAAAAALLGNGDAEPAEVAQLGERRLGVRLEEGAGLAPQLLLLLGEREIHQRLRGRPSTRSAMMLRRISEVPASIVFPRERSCWCCQ